MFLSTKSNTFYYIFPTNAQHMLKIICFVYHSYTFRSSGNFFLCTLKLQINKIIIKLLICNFSIHNKKLPEDDVWTSKQVAVL
jgi:hypothetical protein